MKYTEWIHACNNIILQDCYNFKKKKFNKQCRQTHVFLWEGDVYNCYKADAEKKKHTTAGDSFCRCCAQIIKGRALIRCPTDGMNHQNPNKEGKELIPVKDKKTNQ